MSVRPEGDELDYLLRNIPDKWAQPPKEMIGKLPKAGTSLDYVGHATVTKILLEIDPLWSLEPVCDERGIPIVETVGKDAVMWGRLTVLGHSRLGVGTCPAGAFDRDKQLISDLLRNCAMRFGIATALWSKEEWSQPVRYEVNVEPPEPKATAVQLGEIKGAIGFLDDDAKTAFKQWWKDNQFPGIDSGQLSERQAAVILARLEASPSGGGGDPAPEGSGDTNREEVDSATDAVPLTASIDEGSPDSHPGNPSAAARQALEQAKR